MGCTASTVASRTGELLPHLFTLILFRRKERLFSVALPCFMQLPVRKHVALRCPDFPLFFSEER